METVINSNDPKIKRGINGTVDFSKSLPNHVVGNAQYFEFGSFGGNAAKEFTRFNKKFLLNFEGNVYNASELRKALVHDKYGFETDSAEELLLYNYYENKLDFGGLIGEFAVSIYDPFIQSVILFRDHFGVKPLYYTVVDSCLIFGSELPFILNHPITPPPELDESGLTELFALGPARRNNSSMLKNIYQLPPGHNLIFSADGLKINKYWDLKQDDHMDSYSTTVEKVRHTLVDAIKRQMDFSKQQCSFLSGGLDSTLVTAICGTLYKNYTSEKLPTYSFDYYENDKYFISSGFQPEMDKPWVEKAVKALDTDHTYLYANSQNLYDYLYKAVDAKGLPGMADIDSSLLFFCEQVNSGIAFTGECSDEIFGGYPWYRADNAVDGKMNMDSFFPWSQDYKFRGSLLNVNLCLRDFAYQAYVDSIEGIPDLDGLNEQDTNHRRLFYLNVKWFMQTLIDRMGVMTGSVSAKAPFCDVRLVQYLFNVPWSMKYKNDTVKGLLRDAGRGLVTDELLFRKKSPFPKIYNPSYEKNLSDELAVVLSDNESPLHSFVDKNKVFEFIESKKDYGCPWYGQLMAGPQMLAYLLQINYWLRKYSIKVNI